MNIRRPYILTINAGSSSIKFALFSVAKDHEPSKVFDGAVLAIGWPTARITVREQASGKDTSRAIQAPDHLTAVKEVVAWLKQRVPDEELFAIGHRVVHGGMQFYESQIITSRVVAELRKNIPLDPLHLPDEIKLIEVCSSLFPDVIEVACFDTAFHHDMPRVAQLLPTPRRYESQGLRRYGFHGLSCMYILRELERHAGTEVAKGRIIIAHLGNGASLTAIVDGKSIDTTMSLTPAAGIPMSTRTGDIDPGIVRFLAHSDGQTADEFDKMVNEQSGLLGVSETTSDMEELLKNEDTDVRAKEAADLFCHNVKKQIGALAAVMGGVDTLVFTGGMGENAPKIRARACDGLDFLGILIEKRRNERAEGVISPDGGRVTVRMLHTDESQTIAREILNIQEERNK